MHTVVYQYEIKVFSAFNTLLNWCKVLGLGSDLKLLQAFLCLISLLLSFALALTAAEMTKIGTKLVAMTPNSVLSSVWR